MSKIEDDVHCSFCNKGRDEAKQLIAGLQEGTYICNDCVALCQELIIEKSFDIVKVSTKIFKDQK